MDFPTIKKPKSNKHPTAAAGGSKESLFSKLEALEQSSATPPASAKVPTAKSSVPGKVPSAKTGGAGKVPSAKTGSDDSDIIKAHSDLADKVTKSVGDDKSDKAEAVRIRALLVKSRANSLGEKGAMSEQENPKRKKKK